MSSLIKNQILKHLTKFFKDLTPEQLNMNALMGSCELSNLQLNEAVLMNLMELPVWLKITSAVVDKIYIKISWTKIKSVPIQMHLNEVSVEIEVCDKFRSSDEGETLDLSQYLNTSQQPSKYGFVDRVIDGITVKVNSVNISFKSKLMAATFNLSRVLLESRCPNWKPGELSLTRIKDTTKGHILLFKICEWHTMRLEAKSLTNPEQTPLRLITNLAQCRLTIKKKLDDCSVVAARIFVIFEDILWILTFAQFISASAFVEYIFSLIKHSPLSKKNETLSGGIKASGFTSSGQVPLISPLNTPAKKFDKPPFLTGNMSSASLIEQKFRCYDIVETSMHLFIEKVDAHLYDDIDTPKQPKDKHSGGAMQLTLNQIQLDCYPYSHASGDRSHWFQWFDPAPTSRKQWCNSHLVQYQKKMQAKIVKEGSDRLVPVESLLSLTVLFKIKEFCMNCVATNESTARNTIIKKFIHTDKDYQMPADMPSLYLELNYFYYFDAINQMMVYDDVPDPLAFLHLSPTKLLFDSPTLLFLNSFYVNLSKALVNLNDLFPQDTTPPKIHARIEVLMPQLSLSAKSKLSTNAQASKLFVKSGKICLSNSLYDDNVMQKLKDTINKLNQDSIKHIHVGAKLPRNRASVWDLSILEQARSELSSLKQLWAFQLEPFWLDFMNNDSSELASANRLQQIVEPVKAYIFLHVNLRDPELAKQESKVKKLKQNNKRDIISILVTLIDEPIIAMLNKTQFRFLKRFFAHLDKFLQQMRNDLSDMIQLDHVTKDTLELHLAAYINQIKTKVMFDKNPVELDSCDAGDETNNETTEKDAHEFPVKTSSPETIQSADLKLSTLDSSPITPRSDFVVNSSQESYSSSTKSKHDFETLSIREKFEYAAPDVLTIDDGSSAVQILDVDDLDGCEEATEVAGDATCLLFEQDLSTLAKANKSFPSNNDCINSNINEEFNLIGKTRNSDALAGDIMNVIQESASLFEKVKLNSNFEQQQHEEDEEEEEQQDEHADVELESYFELALSELVFKTNALS